jgi:exopolysaccharide biosynthesis protein
MAEWQKATSMGGGGPQLIKDGRVEITNAAEKHPAGICQRPSSADGNGETKSGDVLLVVVDGRQTGSIGMSLNAGRFVH